MKTITKLIIAVIFLIFLSKINPKIFSQPIVKSNEKTEYFEQTLVMPLPLALPY